MQNAYQMILRIAVRAPLMLVCSMCMCFFISVQLSAVFLVALVVLGGVPHLHHDPDHPGLSEGIPPV